MKRQTLELHNEVCAARLVAACEAGYRRDVRRVCRAICAQPDLRVLTLAGPTCSGKTTTASAIEAYLDSHGREVSVISLDDFFRDTTHVDRISAARAGEEIDYDSPAALDLAYLRECVDRIQRGQSAQIPVFNFKTGGRDGYRTFDPKACDVVLLEGIQAVFPEVVSMFDPEHTFRIYISVADDICVNGEVFDARTVRLIRRIIRDYQFRNAEPEFTLFLWNSVTLSEDRYILPNAQNSDVCINSLLRYEINAARDVLLPILGRVCADSPFAQTAGELMKKIRSVSPMSDRLIPADSLYREFIGPLS